LARCGKHFFSSDGNAFGRQLAWQKHNTQVISMTTGSQQVSEDYEQLKELLELYPNISIVKTEGQPPDSYEIEYNLRGYTKEGNAPIGIGQTHRVRLSLPFGYPHFAPTAKPLTSVFHPDFDPGAIRLADYWQQNPSLPELVLHIGEMICGIVYNLDDPFNQEAAEWYKNQQAQLPLDTVSIADIEAMDSPLDLDVLDDDNLISLGLEESDTFFIAQPPADRVNIQYIRNLIEENNIFTANRMLTDLPADTSAAEREEMQLHIGKVLRKVDQLFKLAEQLESMSKLTEAMEVVDNIRSLAADAPGADALKRRLQQAMLAAPFASASGKPGKAEAKSATSASSPPSDKRASKPAPRLELPSFKPILTAILVLAVAASCIFLYFKDQDTLSQSQASLLRGQQLIEKKQFHQALETLEKAKAILSDLTILRFRKSEQEQAINNQISISDLQEGLQGRILHQGEYIPASSVPFLGELNALTDQAQSLAEQNKIAEALVLYRQALKFATDLSLGNKQTSIGETIHSLELRHSLALAEKAEQNKNWDEAVASYRKALSLTDKTMNLSVTSDITNRMTAAIFNHELDLSKKAFAQSQWRDAIRYLERAQQTIDANPSVVSEKDRQDLHQRLISSRLYFMLSTAREAYQQKKWAQSIDNYQNALKLLNREPDIGKLYGESPDKIEMTLLMVKIAQIQDQIFDGERRKEDPTVTLSRYREILRLIKESAHQDDPAVKNVAQRASEKIDKQHEVLLQQEKAAWLEENFEDIFRANYPTFKGSKLSQPKAVFAQKIGSRLVFTLTCMERSAGSSSKLELNYQFDISTGRWSVFHD